MVIVDTSESRGRVYIQLGGYVGDGGPTKIKRRIVAEL